MEEVLSNGNIIYDKNKREVRREVPASSYMGHRMLTHSTLAERLYGRSRGVFLTKNAVHSSSGRIIQGAENLYCWWLTYRRHSLVAANTSSWPTEDSLSTYNSTFVANQFNIINHQVCMEFTIKV